MRKTWLVDTIAIPSVVLVALSAHAATTIRLSWRLLDDLRNRVVIEASFRAEHANNPHAQADDGDLHIAGRSRQVRLAFVAELMNARQARDTIATFQELARNTATTRVAGVWRIWCEHGGGDHIEGESIEDYEDTNPPHVFEIHPVTRVGTTSLLHTLATIPGYEPKDPAIALAAIMKRRCHLSVSEDDVTITTTAVAMNYIDLRVQFVTPLRTTPTRDGFYAYADLETIRGRVLDRHRRVLFVAASDAARRARGLRKNGCVRVLGMPRLNLAEIVDRAERADDDPSLLDGDLPYEIVVLAVTGECGAPTK